LFELAIYYLKEGASSMPEQRRNDRRDFLYYMQVTDALSKQLIGHLTEISPSGSAGQPKQIPAEDLTTADQLTPDVACKDFMVFMPGANGAV
jgi:hypothetical protein